MKIFFVLFMVSSLLSCDLDRFPANAIATPQALETIEDARNWDNGVFSFFRGRQYGIFTFLQDVQADQLNATQGFGNRNGDFHTWVNLSSAAANLNNVWFGHYAAITNVNFLINEFSVLYATLENAEERAELNRFLGNAHFARAFFYNGLALRWSKSFDPATAATTLSVPIVTEFNPAYRPARATLQEVYNLILSDIAEARRLLADVAPPALGTTATRFNRDVVTALEARVALYMQNWAGAYAAASTLIASGRYPLETTEEGLVQLWVHDNSNEVIMQSHIASPLELPNVNAGAIITNNFIYLGYATATNTFGPDFLPSQWVVDMFDANDLRRGVYFSNEHVVNISGLEFPYISEESAEYDRPALYIVTKFRGNPSIPNSHIGGAGNAVAATNAQAPKVFRIAEMYLIAAEAAFRLGNEANARTALNTLRQARGLSAVTASGDALFQEIKDERFRELAFEGFRLFDLRRWGLGFERREPQFAGALTTGVNFERKVVPAGHHQFVWGIPMADMTTNPNLVQNPGW